MWTEYTVHMSNFSLRDQPLQGGNYRDIWKPFFESSQSISSLRQNMKGEGLFCIWPRGILGEDSSAGEKYAKVRYALHDRINVKHSTDFLESQGYLDTLSLVRPPAPFMPNFGSFQLSARMIRYAERGTKGEVFDAILTGRTEAQEPYFWNHNPFGFKRPIHDQRFWLVFMELSNPKDIFARLEDGTRIEGRFYIHLFPNGLATILFSSKAIISNKGNAVIESFLRNCRPWRKNDLLWKDKKGIKKTLNSWLEDLRSNLSHSLFENTQSRPGPQKWVSVYKIDSNSKRSSTYRELSRAATELDLGRYSNHINSVSFGKQGTVVEVNNNVSDKKRNKLRFLWNVAFLLEYVEMRKNVLESYRDFLSSETDRLRNLRLNFRKKMKEDDVLKITQYDETILEYLKHLDADVRNLKPFYRKLYSEMCNATEFDPLRKSTLRAFDAWVGEVEKWDNPALASVRAIFSPIRLILGG